MPIFLLTHAKECLKKSNTGRLVLEVLGAEAQLVIWDRVNPDTELLNCIDQADVALLYPSADSQLVTAATEYSNYIVIDGTWQQAQKIYNRSPYLKALPAVKISVTQPSAFHLRRNQKEGGLCTAECVIEILKAGGDAKRASDLHSTFLRHIGSPSEEAAQ